MWNLKLDAIAGLLGREGLPPLAIETGTCRGNATKHLSRHFEKVISIELSKELHLEARQRLAGHEFRNVELVLGNSADVLPRILEGLTPPSPIFFFLDAHWSGDQTVNWEKANWKGYGFDTAHLARHGVHPTAPEQCPLLLELSTIMKHWRGGAVILIDDLKNIPETGQGLKDNEFPGEDWSHVSRQSILDLLAPRLKWHKLLAEPLQWLISLD